MKKKKKKNKEKKHGHPVFASIRLIFDYIFVTAPKGSCSDVTRTSGRDERQLDDEGLPRLPDRQLSRR